MSFISWLIFGVFIMIAEIATGTFYLLAIGLALLYPAAAAYYGANTALQLAIAAFGIIGHVLLIMSIRKRRPQEHMPLDDGQRVKILEWNNDGSARVFYRGAEWQADKLEASMPNTDFGVILKIQGNRLLIKTEQLN